MKTVLLNGSEVSFDACVALMDDDIREKLNSDLAPCDEQTFIDAYCKAHLEKYGKEFEI